MAEVEHRKVEFIANPTQRRFIESRHQADLFSSRKGEGKSAALVWSCFYHTRFNPGATWLGVRDTFENLRRTTMREFFRWFPDGVFGKYYPSEKRWAWDTARTGLEGEIFWLGADDEQAATKIASMPLAGAMIDEPAPAAGDSEGVPEMVMDTIIGQLRQPGMKWYALKLAQNNPDETHWTYRRFVDPGNPPDKAAAMFAKAGVALLPDQQPGFVAYQTKDPENLENLPPGYYENLAETWKHRPDLVKRFVQGKYGYQQVGKAVTPEWNDELHLARFLKPMPGLPLLLLYDGGHNPTCVITQITPMGFWMFLESFVGEGIGMYQLIEYEVRPAIESRYRGFELKHTGDPNLNMAEQSNTNQSAAKVITRELGGIFEPGPPDVEARIEPLKSVLGRTINGVGVVQVDRDKCRHVWYALRGGWHWQVHRGGTQGTIKKNMHSHPGDAVGYGAARYFPLGRHKKTKGPVQNQQVGSYYARSPGRPIVPGNSLGMARKGVALPKEARKIGG